MNFKDTILLTGAGFTANFGGFLAKEMWAKIFNNPKLISAGNVKLELKKNFDFEDIYSKVVDSRRYFTEDQSAIYQDVVNQAYLSMDEVLKQPTWWDTAGVHPANLGKFLEYFTQEENNQSGVCFTLNQDLFLERQYGWQPLAPTSMRYAGNFGQIDPKDMNANTPKVLPTEEELNEYKSKVSGEFAYIKLHGSSRWVAADGKETKIIGINKVETINKVPLLKWYFELFQQALYRNNVNLVIIGYGFRDQHINDCIEKAVTEFKTKLYIISPEDPDDFSFRLNFKYPRTATINDTNEKGARIWHAVEGYFPYKLKDIFPSSGAFTAEKTELFDAIGIA